MAYHLIYEKDEEKPVGDVLSAKRCHGNAVETLERLELLSPMPSMLAEIS